VESASIEYRSFGLVAAAAAGKEEVQEMDEKPSGGSRFSATHRFRGKGESIIPIARFAMGKGKSILRYPKDVRVEAAPRFK